MATKKQTKVQIPNDGVEANVVETIGGKRVSYKAPVIEEETNESEIDDTDDPREIRGIDDFETEFEAPFEEIPQSRLERLFDDIRNGARQHHLPDQFYAYITRQPDLIGVNFNRPCITEMQLGAFQFRAADFMEFHGAIQKRNGNSGGMFNIKIFKADRAPLTVQADNYHVREVGVANYFVPDPPPEVEPATNGGGGAVISELIREMRAEREQMFSLMREQFQATQTAPKEKSILEQALERKLMREIENPPESRNDTATEVAKTMTAIMSSFMTAPAVMQKMASSMFPEPPKEKEPTFVDQANEFVDSPLGRQLLPVATGLVDKIGDLSTAFAAKKMNLSGADLEAAGGQPYYENPSEKTEMQMLIEAMIAEVESDREFDASNEFLQTLQAEYPDEAQTLIDSCKALPFESVLNLMVTRTKKMQPSPFIDFVDMEATQQGNGQIVWNERGQKAIARLETLYKYVRTLDDLP